MISSHVATNYGDIKLGHINWKQYNIIKKKAMEQEFSWSGLVLSLSIAFFVVIFSAYTLSSIYTITKSNGFGMGQDKANRIYCESVYEINSSSSFFYVS